MASSSAPVHPARYLSIFLFMLVGVYLLVFLTGDKKAAPKLGIDLQGGTRVTLTARTPDGSRPSRDALAQAQQIISARVNGLGVSGSEVVVDGDNLVITVPGTDGSQARNLGQTARLYIRPVLNSMPAQGAEPKPPQQPAGTAPGAPGAPGGPGPGIEPAPGGQPAHAMTGQPAPPGRPAPQPRPYPQDPPPSPSPAPPAPASNAPAPGAPGEAPPAEAPAPADPRKDLADRIADEKKWRQSTRQGVQFLALQFEATRCDKDDILAGNDDPAL
ncbi:MAG: preprotein translocase subunit SecD, partial [Mycobacterium sp.]|nr:preprotein translocase subunit SecD [Mycobacterium sp.]